MRPGWVRAAWVTPAFFLIGMYIVVALRWLAGWDPIYDWEIIVLIAGMVTRRSASSASARSTLAVLGHGARDARRRPREPRRVQLDRLLQGQHRPQGDRRPVPRHDGLLLLVGGFLAMLFRAELAQPGMQFFDTQTFNGLVSAHATLMIFVFIIPAFAGLRTSPCR